MPSRLKYCALTGEARLSVKGTTAVGDAYRAMKLLCPRARPGMRGRNETINLM